MVQSNAFALPPGKVPSAASNISRSATAGIGRDAALDVACLADLDHLHHRLARARLDGGDALGRFRAMELQQVDGAGRQPLIEQRIVGIDEQAGAE